MDDSTVIRLSEKRDEIIENKRREFERVLFKHLLGVYCFIENKETNEKESLPVQLVDLSPKGMLIQIPQYQSKKFFYNIGDNFTLRLYFSQHTYLPVNAVLKYKNDHTEITGIEYGRFGLELDTTTPSYQAMEHFIQFIYTYAQCCVTDKDKYHVL